MISDFIFKIDNKEYKCFASSISSFSPFVLDLIRRNQFWYNFESLKDPNEDFRQLIKLIDGFEIDISISNVTLLNEVSKILQIQPLFKETDSFIKSIKHTPDNNLSLLESYVSHQISCPEVVREIVSKWDSYETLTDIPNEGLLSLSVESLETLFSSENFSISNQETLFELIIKIIEQNGQKYSSLFSHCDFTKLTSHHVSKILKLISLDSLPHQVMIAFKARFPQEVDLHGEYPKVINEENMDDTAEFISINELQAAIDNEEYKFLNDKPQTFKFFPSYDEDWTFKGIFNYLRSSYSKQIFKKYIQLSCGGDKQEYLDSLFHYDYINDYHWDNYSKSDSNLDFRNAWITISFLSHKIKLTDYTLVASDKLKSRPKSWTL